MLWYHMSLLEHRKLLLEFEAFEVSYSKTLPSLVYIFRMIAFIIIYGIKSLSKTNIVK